MTQKKVVILYNQVDKDSSLDDVDVLVQVEAVKTSLVSQGYKVDCLPFSLDVRKVKEALSKKSPDLVFNLTESVNGDDRLIYLATSLLDHLGIPYTGCPTEPLILSSSKLLAKKWMVFHDIPTPAWVSREWVNDQIQLSSPVQFIIKSVWEHASRWFTSDSIVTCASVDELKTILHQIIEAKNKDFFAERFIAGREFNLSILAGEVLAVPEIVFTDYPQEKMKVVDYKAKWHEDSFEYSHTQRSFNFSEADQPVLEKLRAIALKCWEKFHLRGYARVDFRVDEGGNPWVLEINANPCLSPDAGFYAAAAQSGFNFDQVVQRIINDIR